MKKLFTLLLLSTLGTWVFGQGITLPPSGDNQKASITQNIGLVEITIEYSSPDVHGSNGEDRKGQIWGKLVHFGYIDQGFGPSKAAPWRTGANENTIITFSHDVKIQGKDLKAGSYGLFLAVAENGPWTWIFSNNITSWGSYFYNPGEDALRVETTPGDGPYTEWLTFGFDDRQPGSAVAYLQWENKKIPMKIEIPNINDLYVAQMRNELRGNTGFDYLNFAAAAQFCAQNKINLEEALNWSNSSMDANLGGTEDYYTLEIKSQVLNAMAKTAEADATMEKAIKMSGANVQNIHSYGRKLLKDGKKEKAMEIFKFNAQSHPEDKFTPNVGLARGYTAMGDKKNAIKYWELAIKNIPDNQKAYQSQYEAELAKLK